MGLYIGSTKKRIITSGGNLKVVVPKTSSSTGSVNRLLSSDNYILKDSNGLYLLAKESE